MLKAVVAPTRHDRVRLDGLDLVPGCVGQEILEYHRRIEQGKEIRVREPSNEIILTIHSLMGHRHCDICRDIGSGGPVHRRTLR